MRILQPHLQSSSHEVHHHHTLPLLPTWLGRCAEPHLQRAARQHRAILLHVVRLYGTHPRRDPVCGACKAQRARSDQCVCELLHGWRHPAGTEHSGAAAGPLPYHAHARPDQRAARCLSHLLSQHGDSRRDLHCCGGRQAAILAASSQPGKYRGCVLAEMKKAQALPGLSLYGRVTPNAFAPLPVLHIASWLLSHWLSGLLDRAASVRIS
jgi:hypothetical protein